MTESQDHHTVPREDLLFAVEMALRQARRLWPRRRGPGDQDETRLKIIATDVVDHLALCGMRCVAKGPAPLHGTLAPRSSSRHAGDTDTDDAGACCAPPSPRGSVEQRYHINAGFAGVGQTRAPSA